MHRLCFKVAGAIIVLSGAASAQSRTIAAGKPAPMWNAWNCHTNSMPPLQASATHGAVVVRETTQDRCGNAKQPVRQVVYTSKQGFKGQDVVYVYDGGSSRQIGVTVE